MKRLAVVVAAILSVCLCLIGDQAYGDDFFVVASGGRSGKVLKTQILTSNVQNTTLGTDVWEKLDSPQWT